MLVAVVLISKSYAVVVFVVVVQLSLVNLVVTSRFYMVENYITRGIVQ